MLGVWGHRFGVRDLDRSLCFYRDLLGFELVECSTEGSLPDHRPGRARIARLAVPGQQRSVSTFDLELIEWREAPPTTAPETCQPGAAHMALVVDGIRDMHRRLAAAGVRFVSTPNQISAGINKGGYACYLRDPDGLTLEFVEPPLRHGHGA